MKKLLPIILACLSINIATAQILIDASDMPVSGDTLRYSVGAIVGTNINLADSGANKTWSYGNLTPTFQAVDEYETALQVNPLYAITIAPSAYGYKVADSFGIGGISLPVSINEIYNFFSKKTSPNRFVTEAFAAKIASIPTPINYSDEDELYYFPLQYGNTNNSTFRLNIALPSIGSILQKGSRTTKVDGWGTIITPFYTTPVNCIRIRSEIDEIDSVKISVLPAIGLPRKTVEYKWLVKGEHYPALWVTTTVVANTETITNIRYRDSYRPLSVTNKTTQGIYHLDVHPNPTTNEVNIDVPASWKNYVIEVFDLTGKLVIATQNNSSLNLTSVPSGNYIARVISGNDVGYVKITKE